MHKRTRFFLVLVSALIFLCFAATLQAESVDKLTVRVMTRNMDAGTDLNYIAGATDEASFAAAVYQTYAEVLLAGGIPERAAQLAEEIVIAQPDMVALQEATIWHLEGPLGNAEFDQLELLQAALSAVGAHYRVAVVQQLTDIPVIIPPLNLNLRFTDRDAILVRSDVPPGHLDVIDTEKHLYENLLPFLTPAGEIPIYRGWIAADVKIRGARFKFVNTHLETPIPGENFEPTAFLQLLQAMELVGGLNETELPVILAGDFNSDAEAAGIGPDQTLSAAFISGMGYTDAWHAIYPDEHGFTWPLFLEDQQPPNFVIPSTPVERIDLIFSRGPELLSVEQTGMVPGSSGYFASDHVGVMADFQLENHRPDVPVGPRKQH